MSRSALDRRTRAIIRGNVAPVPEEPPAPTGRLVKAGELPIWGNERTYNLNTLLAQNILESDYFKALYELKTYHEVIDEIYEKVTHCEPLSAGTSRIPSTCFCLLYKFFTLRLTVKQMKGLLHHKDSVYIRCVGFLYLRYTCPPKDLWSWYEPFLNEETEFSASADSAQKTTIGRWLRMLLTEMNYFGTMLPRIPVPIQRKMKVQLLLHDEKMRRAKANEAVLHQFVVGAKIRAVYGDEENEPAWYDAVIDSVEPDSMFWVTFPEYGNSELVHLGDMQLQGLEEAQDKERSRSANRGRSSSRDRSRRSHSRSSRHRSPSRSRDRDRHRRRRSRSRSSDRRHRAHRSRRSRSRSRDRDGHRGSHRRSKRSRSRSRSRDRHERRRSDRSRSHSRGRRSRDRGSRDGSPPRDSLLSQSLLDEVLKREREGAEARGRDYASRPASYKGSLSMKVDRYTTRRKSRSRSPLRASSRSSTNHRHRSSRARSPPHSPKESHVSEEAHERLKLLKAKYGDASAGGV